MFSKRLKNLKAYKTETTPAPIKLSSNELPYDLPPDLKGRVSEVLKGIPFNRYPDPNSERLKSAVAEFFCVPEESIVLGNGSDELIYYLSIVIGEFEQGVYIPIPTFPMYEIASDVFGRPKTCVPLDSSFDIDLEESIRRVEEEKPVLAYFSYPNNPTGNLFSRERIEALREKGLFTVVDEAYYSYSGDSFVSDALSREDTVILRTLSKIGLASLRVGILIGREEVVREIDKVRLPFNITYPSQVIAEVVLKEGRDFLQWAVAEVVKERERLYREMDSMEGVEVFPSRANFLLFRTSLPAKELHSRLVDRGVLVRDMSHLPGLEGCLRVSVGKREENDAFLEALYSVVSSLQ